MTESPEHKELKSCAARVFGGQTEKVVDGRVDVQASGFCVEVETTGRTDRLERAVEKLSSPACGGGFLIVPQDALRKANRLVRDKSIIPIPSHKFKRICKRHTSLEKSSETPGREGGDKANEEMEEVDEGITSVFPMPPPYPPIPRILWKILTKKRERTMR